MRHTFTSSKATKHITFHTQWPQPPPKHKKGGLYLFHHFGKYGPSTKTPWGCQHTWITLIQLLVLILTLVPSMVSMHVGKYNIFP